MHSSITFANELCKNKNESLTPEDYATNQIGILPHLNLMQNI